MYCPQCGRNPYNDDQRCEHCKHRKSQMIREEAHKKLNDLDYDTKEGIDYDLKVLEALGLIKFDEPKPERPDWSVIRSCGITKDNMHALFQKGYDIYKIGS